MTRHTQIIRNKDQATEGLLDFRRFNFFWGGRRRDVPGSEGPRTPRVCVWPTDEMKKLESTSLVPGLSVLFRNITARGRWLTLASSSMRSEDWKTQRFGTSATRDLV